MLTRMFSVIFALMLVTSSISAYIVDNDVLENNLNEKEKTSVISKEYLSAIANRGYLLLPAETVDK